MATYEPAKMTLLKNAFNIDGIISLKQHKDGGSFDKEDEKTGEIRQVSFSEFWKITLNCNGFPYETKVTEEKYNSLNVGDVVRIKGHFALVYGNFRLLDDEIAVIAHADNDVE